MLVGLDETDEQRIDQHVVRRAFVRQHLGERHAGGAGNRRRGACAARRLGADIEDIDDLPPAPFLHLRPNEPRQPDRRKQLLVEVVLQEFIRQLLERAGGGGAGIVHDDVDLAQRLHRFVVGTPDVGGDRDIALDADDASAARTDRLDGRIEGLAPAGDNGDIGTRGRKSRRDGKADALACAGDHG